MYIYIYMRIDKHVTRATAGKWVTVPPLLELKLMFCGSFSSFTHVLLCFDRCNLPLNGVYPQQTLVGFRVPCSQCSQSLVHQTSCLSSDFPRVHFEGDHLFFLMILHHEIIMFGVFLELCSNHQRVANVRCRLGVSMGWSDIQFRWKYLGNLKVPPEQMPSTWGEIPDPNIRPFSGEQWWLPSQSLTWNLKMMVSNNRNLLFHRLIFRFHV